MQFHIGTLTLLGHNYDFHPDGFELPIRAVTFEHFGQALAALIRLAPPTTTRRRHIHVLRHLRGV